MILSYKFIKSSLFFAGIKSLTTYLVAGSPPAPRPGVAAVGLNFRDVLNVMGLYPGDPGGTAEICQKTLAVDDDNDDDDDDDDYDDGDGDDGDDHNA